MELEKLGVPTVTLISQAFDLLARKESTALGFRALPLVIVPHPFGNLDRATVRDIGDSVLERVVQCISQPAPETLPAGQKRSGTAGTLTQP
jgi:hypothetical protein